MSEFTEFAREILRRVAEVETENERLRLRLDNVVREGRVTKVDAAKGVAEVDMNGLPSDALPWSQRAGGQVEWDPPAIGERVVVVNPSGEPGLGMIFPGGYSDDNPQPQSEGARWFRKVGSCSILMTGDGITLSAGGTFVKISAGKLETNADRVENKGRNVGHDHTHSGIEPGGADTDIPNA